LHGVPDAFVVEAGEPHEDPLVVEMLSVDGTVLNRLEALGRFAPGNGFGSGEDFGQLDAEGGRQLKGDLKRRAALAPLQ